MTHKLRQNTLGKIAMLFKEHLKMFPKQHETFLDFTTIFSIGLLSAISLNQAIRINSYNKEQFSKVIKSAIGINPLINEPWLQEQMKSFQKNNRMAGNQVSLQWVDMPYIYALDAQKD